MMNDGVEFFYSLSVRKNYMSKKIVYDDFTLSSKLFLLFC